MNEKYFLYWHSGDRYDISFGLEEFDDLQAVYARMEEIKRNQWKPRFQLIKGTEVEDGPT